MKNIGFRVQKRTFQACLGAFLFLGLFLFMGTGQSLAQGDLTTQTSPYGGKTFIEAPEAIQVLSGQLPGLYTQLNALQPGTKVHKLKQLEVGCYKGMISDITMGADVNVAYEDNLATLVQGLNVEDSGDLGFLRGVQSTLFDLLTN